MTTELTKAAQQAPKIKELVEQLRNIANGVRICGVDDRRFVAGRLDEIADALTQRPAAQTWDKNADVCKGAWELGTACGTCAKCIATKPAQRPAAQTEREAFEATAPIPTPAPPFATYDEHGNGCDDEIQDFYYRHCQEVETRAFNRGYDAASLPAPQQAAPEPVGEVVAYREKLTGRLCEPEDTHRRKFPMCYEPLYTRPARGVPEDVQRNAARWEEVLRQVGADRQCGGFRFTLYNLRPIPGSNPMQGAVCQHFTQAVDAALAAAQAKK